MKPFCGLSLSLCSGLLLALLFPPWNLSGLAWIALVPFLTAVLVLSPGPGISVLNGLVSFGPFSWINFWWLWHERRINEFVANVACVSFLGIVFSWYLWRFAKLPALPKRQPGTRVPLQPVLVGQGFNSEPWRVSLAHLRLAGTVAAAWCFLEWGRGAVMPAWNILGISIAGNLPLLQLVKGTGPLGLSFLVVFANVVIFAAVRRLALQPGRTSWSGRFDAIAALAVIFATWLGGFNSLLVRHTPNFKVCLVNSGQSRIDDLVRLSQIAESEMANLVVWLKATFGPGSNARLSTSALGSKIPVVSGLEAAGGRLSGYYVFLPGSVQSVITIRNQPLFQPFAENRSKTLQPITIDTRVFWPLVGSDAGSLANLQSVSKKQGNSFIAFVDSPTGTKLEEEQLRGNLRVWSVALGRALIYQSRRAGANLFTAEGRTTAEVSPGEDAAALGDLSFSTEPPVTLYSSYGDWFPIVCGAIALFSALNERLRAKYANSSRLGT